jgi:hypothetical protein
LPGPARQRRHRISPTTAPRGLRGARHHLIGPWRRGRNRTAPAIARQRQLFIQEERRQGRRPPAKAARQSSAPAAAERGAVRLRSCTGCSCGDAWLRRRSADGVEAAEGCAMRDWGPQSIIAQDMVVSRRSRVSARASARSERCAGAGWAAKTDAARSARSNLPGSAARNSKRGRYPAAQRPRNAGRPGAPTAEACVDGSGALISRSAAASRHRTSLRVATPQPDIAGEGR